MRRLASVVTLLVAVAAQIVLTASPASAYEVRISITGAGQVTETTPANLVGSTCMTSSNNPTGALGKTCFAGTPTGDYGWNWDVDYLATPKPGYRFVRWESDGTTRNGVICDRSTPAATTTTYTGSVCKFRTPYDLQVRAVFVDDTAPAMSSLTGPNGPVNGATAFTFSAAPDPTLTGFECRVAGVHDWTACSSGRTENPSSSGTYTFEVRAVDASGNRSAISSWQWTVDKLAPETIPGSGPSGTVASTSATFNFSSNEQATYECSLDAVLLTSCGSPKFLGGLGQGTHVFTARARDGAGNYDPSPASWTWKVDTVAPDTTLSSAPSSLTRAASASFTYESSEPGGDFVCRLDDEPVPCANPYTVTDGSHTFSVAARDGVGNTDASPASRTWTVDTTAPTVTARAPKGRRVSPTTDVTVTFSEAMRASSVEASRRGKPLAVTLFLGRAKVDAKVRYVETAVGAHRAVLDPDRRLKRGKQYRVAVSTRATDLAGNPVTATGWKFRTRG
jgi:hypothetical protein